VSIHPTSPDTRMAALMATGPRIAASWVSSDMLCNHVRRADSIRCRADSLGSTVVVCHRPCNRKESTRVRRTVCMSGVQVDVPEEERKAFAAPARAVHEFREDPLRTLLVRCQDEERYAYTHRSDDYHYG
jgi:hypothetical protein